MPERLSIHIINPLWNAFGGSERRALALYRLLRDDADVRLWSGYRAAPEIKRLYPIQALQPNQGIFPKDGTLVFVGVYFPVGGWVRAARPQRKIIVLNTYQPIVARELIDLLDACPGPPAEFVFPSVAVRDRYGLPGVVEPSLIDLNFFKPPEQPPANDRFTVGRLSRDHPEKHHAGDAAFYRRLVDAGCAVRIMGGGVLAQQIGAPSPELVLLPEGTVPPVPFLHGLDCFFYRTAEDWYESYGRVVFEAMACEIPVVASRRGGYAEFLASGVDSFLFDSEDEAFDAILRLRSEPELRSRISHAARKTVESIYSAEGVERIRRFYLSAAPVAASAPQA